MTLLSVYCNRAVRAIHDPCTCAGALARVRMCAAEKYARRRIRFGSRSRREHSRTCSGATFLPFSSCIECDTRTRRIGKHDCARLPISSPRIYRHDWTNCSAIIWPRVTFPEWQRGEYFMSGGQDRTRLDSDPLFLY